MRVVPLLVVLLLAASASEAAPRVTERAVIVVTGIFKYERGDVLEYKCPQGVCRDTLVRDRFLQLHGAELFGKDITVRVRRIDACRDPRSTRYACETRLKDTVLLIVEWVHPRDRSRKPGG
jgi:hypothetical protein